MRELLAQLADSALGIMPRAPFDSLSVGIVDFKAETVDSFEVYQGEFRARSLLCFDLASITKPLSLASVFHKYPHLFTEEMQLLLCHRAGLPAWAILPKTGWQALVLRYPIQASPVVYSDLSALRLMLEVEQRSERPHRELIRYYWRPGLYHWLELPEDIFCPETGERQGKPIQRQVHDPNAFNLATYCSHAGLFATADGLGCSLLSMQAQTDFLGQMEKAFHSGLKPEHRFLLGWDTPAGRNSLAGDEYSAYTFGHLGFTGTSVWMDAQKQKGLIILSNTTQYAWYDKAFINELRRKLGTLFWKNI